ncbi:MAG: hypothetical protein WAZ18_01900 [Alphaproteobacteria bacterium]
MIQVSHFVKSITLFTFLATSPLAEAKIPSKPDMPDVRVLPKSRFYAVKDMPFRTACKRLPLKLMLDTGFARSPYASPFHAWCKNTFGYMLPDTYDDEVQQLINLPPLVPTGIEGKTPTL